MNIADKTTLDNINLRVNRIGQYIGYKNSSVSMRYYLPAGTQISCDRRDVSVLQSVGSPNLISEGYEITENSLVTVSAINTNYIEYVAYNIL